MKRTKTTNNVIQLPIRDNKAAKKQLVNMTLTRVEKGMKVFINLSNLTKEELLLALIPPVTMKKDVMEERLEFVKKNISK